ncbi:MAG: TIGR03564 family F420-dependent LLM class oxidoreductase [Chloroflexota bacterium]
MRIGAFVLAAGPSWDWERRVAAIADAEARGFDSAWIANIREYDALTLLALAGQRTSRIELGTFVVPTYPRHPSSLAQQALTTQAICNGRLALGIGLSHRVSMEGGLGFDWNHPIRHMREYLTCLERLFTGEPASFAGQEFTLNEYQLSMAGATRPALLVAALGPQMLKLTGALADGTALWMGGPKYIRDHVVPIMGEAAAAAGRPSPRVVAGLPVCVTDNRDAVRARAEDVFARYGQLPSYRAILDKEGAASPTDVSLIGTEAQVEDGIAQLREAGATELAAAVFAPRGEDPERTNALLRRLKAGS